MKNVNVRWYDDQHTILHITYSAPIVDKLLIGPVMDDIKSYIDSVSHTVHIISDMRCVVELDTSLFELTAQINRNKPVNLGLIVYYGTRPVVRAITNTIARFLRNGFSLHFVGTLEEALCLLSECPTGPLCPQ